MGAAITLTGPVTIDGYFIIGEVFTGTGDDTIQTFSVDMGVYAPPGSKAIGMGANCVSEDLLTMYPVGTAIGTFVNPSASVQVPSGVDFQLSITVAVCL